MKLELFDVTKSTLVFRLLGMVLILVTAVDGAASPSASSVHSSPYQAALAFDGRGHTRWASSDGGNQWVQMDPGKVCAIDKWYFAGSQPTRSIMMCRSLLTPAVGRRRST